jgi:hypothetical protein
MGLVKRATCLRETTSLRYMVLWHLPERNFSGETLAHSFLPGEILDHPKVVCEEL